MIAKTNSIHILQKTKTNQYPAYALKSDDSKTQQYPNPNEDENNRIWYPLPGLPGMKA